MSLPAPLHLTRPRSRRPCGHGRWSHRRTLVSGYGAELRHDVRAHEVRVLEQLGIRRPGEEPREQHGEKGVTRADGVSHLRREARVLGELTVVEQGGATTTTRHAHHAA